MENPLLKSNSSINKKSLIKPKTSKPKNIKIIINESNQVHNIKSKTKSLSKSKTLNNEEFIKTSNLNTKTKSNENPMQKSYSSVTIKKNKSNKKANVDFSKYDIQNMEYIIDKNMKNKLKSATLDKPFLTRMQIDIKNRQTKEEKRKNLLEEYKPKSKEKERIKCFNRLINDSNKRNKVKENIQRQNEFFNSGISPRKITKKKWDYIYENRFYKYQEKIDNNLRERIIENEKKIKQKEEAIIEQINSTTKKVNKKELDKIINRLYLYARKKDLNKNLDNLMSSNRDKANGMKKEEKNEEIDNLDLSRGKKQHHTIQSTKIREKKNSYFGSVIIKTSTFQQGKTNSLIKFIQNIGKSENKQEKRHTITTEQKEIKEMESENLNISNLNSSNNKIESNNFFVNNNDKKRKNVKSISNMWSNDIGIKKSQSQKRIFVNDFNKADIKMNINSKYKNKSEKIIKKIKNGLNIINPEYYYKNFCDDDNSELKINDININEFIINDLKKNINTKNKINKKKHFNCPKYKNYNTITKNSLNNNINNKYLSDKKSEITNNKYNNKIKRFIDETSAIKIVEDIFGKKIKNK